MKADEELRERIRALEQKELKREKKEVITEWLHTKCIWVWTLLLGWLFTAGVFIAEHYDRVSVIVAAALKAFKETGK